MAAGPSGGQGTPQKNAISVIPADELLHADEAELEAFIQSLLTDQEGGGAPCFTVASFLLLTGSSY